MKKLILIVAFLISSVGISQVTKEDFKELSNRNGFPLENIFLVSLTHVDYYNCGNKSTVTTNIKFKSDNSLLELNDNGLILNVKEVLYRDGDVFKVSECSHLDTYFIPYESIRFLGFKNDFEKPELEITLKK